MVTIHYFKTPRDQGWKTFDDFNLAATFQTEKRAKGYCSWRTYPD